VCYWMSRQPRYGTQAGMIRSFLDLITCTIRLKLR
jgi:hypothetical protein